ncbi:MAG: hypothetical protein HC822_18330 [Oscillochloris sp.]|nr:hypothetical protein [Oscillochloris sp.]
MTDSVRLMALQARPWRHKILGSGALALDPSGLQLINLAATQHFYSDAQIDDYQVRAPHFLHRPPLRLSLQARFSHPAAELSGTAGFGFWNYPSAFPPRPPQAVWFFSWCAAEQHSAGLRRSGQRLEGRHS